MANLNGILKDSKIRGGQAVIRGTSIEVSRIILYMNDNFPEKDILQRFPTINPEHLKKAEDYYKTHKEEIDAEICLIANPEKRLANLGYKIIEEKAGIRRVVEIS